MTLLRAITYIALPLCALAQSPCRTTRPIDLAPLRQEIAPREISFVALDLASGECRVSDAASIKVRHTPWSTFKVPHYLIALETGAAKSGEEKIAWDAKRRPRMDYWPEGWAQDQTLDSAFRVSAAWAFQELVARVGERNYHTWLSRFHYGNQVVPHNDDGFWLNATLRIAPIEQVAFLSHLVEGQTGVSERSFAALRNVAFKEERAGARLYAKTGAGDAEGNMNGAFDGWLVGWVERDGARPVVFAFWTHGPTYKSIVTFRTTMAKRLLSEIGAWPK